MILLLLCQHATAAVSGVLLNDPPAKSMVEAMCDDQNGNVDASPSLHHDMSGPMTNESNPCVDLGCECCITGCNSLTTIGGQLYIALLSTSVGSSHSLDLSQVFLTSLYRPPITS